RKVLAIGVREPVSPFFEHTHTDGAPAYPSLAKISGILLDSIFLDALEMDREQMTRVNRLLEEIPGGITDDRGVRLSSVEFLYVGPSRDLAAFAVKHREEMPRAVRYMLKGLGAEREGGGELLSYLLFEAGYCGELMDLGYKDALAQTSELQNFLWSD
ncbi:MAG TPA: patatin-like phospholipase family protein, partial [Planctomycetota bacterium]|nr:patatin-like phospholipase family protein [Planctomycetota bacterium]